MGTRELFRTDLPAALSTEQDLRQGEAIVVDRFGQSWRVTEARTCGGDCGWAVDETSTPSESHLRVINMFHEYRDGKLPAIIDDFVVDSMTGRTVVVTQRYAFGETEDDAGDTSCIRDFLKTIPRSSVEFDGVEATISPIDSGTLGFRVKYSELAVRPDHARSHGRMPWAIHENKCFMIQAFVGPAGIGVWNLPPHRLYPNGPVVSRRVRRDALVDWEAGRMVTIQREVYRTVETSNGEPLREDSRLALDDDVNATVTGGQVSVSDCGRIWSHPIDELPPLPSLPTR